MLMLDEGIAKICVKNLRLRTFIGIKEEEINNRQDIIINLTILYSSKAAVAKNEIEYALNYRTITKEIITHVENNRFALLERLTQELVDRVMAHKMVQYVEVEVDKPQALRYSDSVSLTLSGKR